MYLHQANKLRPHYTLADPNDAELTLQGCFLVTLSQLHLSSTTLPVQMSSIVRYHNRSVFQSHVCNLFMSGMLLLSVTVNSILGRFPFVRTDWPGYSHRNEKITFNQSYRARSVKS